MSLSKIFAQDLSVNVEALTPVSRKLARNSAMIYA